MRRNPSFGAQYWDNKVLLYTGGYGTSLDVGSHKFPKASNNKLENKLLTKTVFLAQESSGPPRRWGHSKVLHRETPYFRLHFSCGEKHFPHTRIYKKYTQRHDKMMAESSVEIAQHSGPIMCYHHVP